MSIKSRLLELRAKFSLDKTTDDERIVILNELKTIKVNKDVLKATSIGLTINKFRKSENENVRKLVKAVVSIWKQLVLKEGPITPSPKPKAGAKSPKLPSPVPKKPTASLPPAKPAPQPTPATQANFKALYKTGDKIRDKIQKLFYEQLGADENEAHRADLAVQIELELFKTNKQDTGRAYKDKYRQVIFFFRDKSNPDFNKAVISGRISPNDVVTKDAAYFASDEVKKRRKEEAQESIDARRSDWDNAQDTGWCDMFQCPECGGRKTKFNQKQIRGADEPMTCFIFCGDCGHRWTDGDH